MTHRNATIEDFNPGTALFDSAGYKHILASRHSGGMWNTTTDNVVFENEAQFYTVAI